MFNSSKRKGKIEKVLRVKNGYSFHKLVHHGTAVPCLWYWQSHLRFWQLYHLGFSSYLLIQLTSSFRADNEPWSDILLCLPWYFNPIQRSNMVSRFDSSTFVEVDKCEFANPGRPGEINIEEHEEDRDREIAIASLTLFNDHFTVCRSN